MTKTVVALSGLARALGAAPELMRRLERAGLIVPLGRDREGHVWVDAEARQKVERVQSLISAGYAERDIALVIGRIERSPDKARMHEVLALDAMAAATKAGPAALVRWVAAGLLAPWALDDQGAPLFPRASVELARAFAALEALGLGDQLEAWARLARGEGDGGAIEALRERVTARLTSVQSATRALKKLLPRLATRAPKPRRRLLARKKDGAHRLKTG